MKIKATVVFLVALVGGAAMFTWRAVRPEHESAVDEPELRWLQREFALNDDVSRRIAELHRKYVAACEPMCVALQKNEAELTRLMMADKSVTPGLEKVLVRSNRIVADCQRRMVEHFYAVAKEMPPAAGERYLALMTSVAAHPGQGWMKIAPQTAASLRMTEDHLNHLRR